MDTDLGHSDYQVDIVIPLYNKEDWIAATLDSIIAQTFQNWLLYIVDDGSTDQSAELVKPYLKDERIRLFQQENAGPGAARNYGASLGDATFLAFLDADDRWLPEFLQATIEALSAHPDCAMVATSSYRGPQWENNVPINLAAGISSGLWRCPTSIAPSELRAATAFFTPSAVLMRRKPFQAFGGFFDRWKCTYAEDSYLYLRILMHNSTYRLLEPLYWRNLEGSELAEGRTTPYPISPHLLYAEELISECPTSHRETLERFIDWHTVFTARQLARQGQGREARALLRERFPANLPDEHAKTAKQIYRWSRAWPIVRLARYAKAQYRKRLSSARRE